MSTTMKRAVVIGLGLLTAAIVYLLTDGDVIWSIVGLLVVFSVGRFVAHPGSAG